MILYSSTWYGTWYAIQPKSTGWALDEIMFKSTNKLRPVMWPEIILCKLSPFYMHALWDLFHWKVEKVRELINIESLIEA